MERKDKTINSSDFGEEFAWGVSASAFQTEGACDIHDKGPSIWDEFTRRKGAIYRGQHARNSCDFYHRFPEDIKLMRALNIRNFRFSLSWPRLLPQGYGAKSDKGTDYYHRLIDNCLESDITPWLTLYHWDLPSTLQDEGGWTNRNILDWFESYTAYCAQKFGDRVKNWIVLNEPMVFTGAGYFLGVHAPGLKGMNNFLPAMHHAMLCQSLGARVLRSEVTHANIGTTYSSSYITPQSTSYKDLRAAGRADALLNRLFIEPVLGMGYPIDSLPFLKRLERFMRPCDMSEAKFDFDFIGVQNYTREVVKYSPFVPYIKAKIVEASKRSVRQTLMGWEVYPRGIYEIIRQFSNYQGVKRIVVTENGAAFNDILDNGSVADIRRISFLKDYLAEVLKAQQETSKVQGYFVWTFTDNFEWAEGFRPRFGLVYTDFESQRRIVKKSGYWYKDFLAR